MNSTKGRPYGTNKKAERDASYFQTSGALLKASSDWASIVENFPYGLGALIFYILLLRRVTKKQSYL